MSVWTHTHAHCHIIFWTNMTAVGSTGSNRKPQRKIFVHVSKYPITINSTVQIKLSLCLTKHYAMMKNGGVDV
jgi:hypothetical protein